MFPTINKSTAINNNAKRTPFCKVCIDAGLPKSVYESHWVKTLDGKVCCPTLLEQPCRYCKLKGHTVKFCNLLKQEEPKQLYPVNKPNAIKLQQIQPTNVFATLYESDSDDENTKKKVKPTYRNKCDNIPMPKPVINANTQLSNIKTYASVLITNDIPSKVETTIPTITLERNVTTSNVMSEEHKRIFKSIKIITNWADYSDTDSD